MTQTLLVEADPAELNKDLVLLKDEQPEVTSEQTNPKHKPTIQSLIESQSDCV